MSQAIGYTPISPLDLTYDLSPFNAGRRFGTDQILSDAMTTSDTEALFAEIARLSISDDWQDRVRAEALRASTYEHITLPDQFPCIYNVRSTQKSNRVWVAVASADADMLETLLPLYIELWDAYESQWPHKDPESKRDFVFGHLDGVSPKGVYLPGTTAAEVIGRTMLTHDGMYRLAPDHLKVMHPMHQRWIDAEEKRRRQFREDTKKGADAS